MKTNGKKFGICHLSIISVRKEPSSKSEMTTQILYGETYLIIKIENGWYYIENSYDGYSGWINYTQVREISLKNFNLINYEKKVFSLDWNGYVMNNFKDVTYVPFGSLVSSSKYLDQTFFGKSSVDKTSNIIEIAKCYINTPYLWGGRGNFGIDCSGLTQNIFKICGLFIKRDAYLQIEDGVNIDYSQIEPGCLAFFGEKKITHVGVLINKRNILHAFGCVRIDIFSGKGIVNSITKKITHKLLQIRKY